MLCAIVCILFARRKIYAVSVCGNCHRRRPRRHSRRVGLCSMRQPGGIRSADIFCACRVRYGRANVRCYTTLFPLLFSEALSFLTDPRSSTAVDSQQRIRNESCSHHDDENMFINFIIGSRTIAELSARLRSESALGGRVARGISLRLCRPESGRKIIIIFIWGPLKMRVVC